MKYFLIFLAFLIHVSAFGQIVDWHNHITAKHYIHDIYKPDSINYYINKLQTSLPKKYKTNWKTYNTGINHKDDSHYGNYYQSTFTDLQKGDFKIVVQSISPLELNPFYDKNK